MSVSGNYSDPPSIAFVSGFVIYEACFFQLVADPSGPAFDLVVPAEIVIGTIPLVSESGNYSAPPPPVANQPAGHSGGPPAPAPAAGQWPAGYSRSSDMRK